MRTRHLGGTAIIYLLLAGIFLNTCVRAESPIKGAYLDKIRFIQYLDDNVALQEVRSGNLDTYFSRIPLEALSNVKTDPSLKVYDRNAGTLGLLFNPAPSKDDNSINPFQFREVRFAMNYLVDRDFVVDEILGGHGTSITAPFSVYSPEYFNVLNTIETFGFRYNPQFAQKIISDILTAKAGAVKQAGKWFFKGHPINIKILIRTDDTQRLSIGELVASELQGIGFVVQKDYGDLNKANSIVYGSNPQDFQWQVYTEAFVASAFVKYDSAVASQMYAPFFGNMPGRQNPAFWNYQNQTLDKLTKRIQFFNFTSEGERNQLLQDAVKAGTEESVRIFIAQNTEPLVASSKLNGLINDFGAGITSKLSLINARTPKSSNTLDIGVKQIYQGAWNNVEGCKDAYCTQIYSALSDSATLRNPYTGDVIPMREPWIDISTKGPNEKLKVPPDAQIWDPYSEHWKSVGQNASSMSKVTYKILYSNWHNGIPMDKSDLLYTQYFLFQWGTNTGKDDLTIDPEFSSQAQAALPLVKGLRFITNDEVESYINTWFYDKKEIADAATIWPAEPWEITAATERLVTAGRLAYSLGEATARNVDWLSLLVPKHAEMIKEELEKMKSEGYVPPALKGLVSVANATRRYDASISWITNHNNAVVGNGPFYLDGYNPAGGIITIKAFRDPSYPFSEGYWSSFEFPKLATLQSIIAPQFISIGQPTIVVNLTVNVGGKPSNDVIVNFFISNKDDRVVVQGVAKTSSGDNKLGAYSIILDRNNTSKLSIGPNTLKIFVNSRYAFKPDIYSAVLIKTFSPLKQ